MKRVLQLFGLIALLMLGIAPAMAAPLSQDELTIVDHLSADGRFTTLVEALAAANLIDTLAEGSYTLFAPTDDAFIRMPPGAFVVLVADSTALGEVLRFHIAGEPLSGADLAELTTVETLQREPLNVSLADDAILINSAQIIEADIEAANGVIHVIDKVLLPTGETRDREATPPESEPPAEPAPADAEAVEEAEPSVDAVDEAESEGEGETEATTDIAAESEAESAPEAEPIAGTAELSSLTSDGNGDIIDTLLTDGRFTTLLDAMQTANLTSAFQGQGPYTLFAPTDDAFAALPEGTLPGLLGNYRALRGTILYHVIGGKMVAADLPDLSSAITGQGGRLTFSEADEVVMVNNARIIAADVETANGIIHIIDTVLIPEVRLPETGLDIPQPCRIANLPALLPRLSLGIEAIEKANPFLQPGFWHSFGC